MGRLTWDRRDYESGLDFGVLYSSNGVGEAWNGLVAVTEADDDSDENTRYIDGVKTRVRRRSGSFAGTIEAYSYPPSFYDDYLTQRRRPALGMSYRIQKTGGSEVHLVYNLQIPRGEISRKQNESGTFRWDFTTLPVLVPGAKLSAHLVIDTSLAYSWTVSALLDILYGTAAAAPRLPSPSEVMDVFESNSILRITDHGDGTWSAEGPDSVVYMTDDTTFEINWPSAVYVDEDTYTVHSL